ncbi:hypothetical protein PFICI_04598 [Pestalotiopsis fici W106-1]|uniref:Uncharacterized protein n=1 Tax=Pestalotiopsis fici (strain W106-1 / CGMCC3.15140) TaxID=1229662 RepID=W3XBC9_PESFW|nr:uncharacterized protein PFICI_04598 [Pestalotiopsis fici W106-1]ETS82722.1 hypothetical protein PFICI_04598 [Pestalotiopsis fici W106-1]
MTFLSSLQPGSSNTLFLWTPIGIQTGILVAVGLQECASMVSWRKIRGLILSTLEGLRVFMGAEDSQLPRYESGQYAPSLPSLANRNARQTLSSPTPDSVTVFQRSIVTSGDGSEDNPWRFH